MGGAENRHLTGDTDSSDVSLRFAPRFRRVRTRVLRWSGNDTRKRATPVRVKVALRTSLSGAARSILRWFRIGFPISRYSGEKPSIIRFFEKLKRRGFSPMTYLITSRR